MEAGDRGGVDNGTGDVLPNGGWLFGEPEHGGGLLVFVMVTFAAKPTEKAGEKRCIGWAIGGFCLPGQTESGLFAPGIGHGFGDEGAVAAGLPRGVALGEGANEAEMGDEPLA
jgi:hypothetical protein